MKKILAFCGILILSVLCFACANQSTTSVTTTTTSNSTSSLTNTYSTTETIVSIQPAYEVLVVPVGSTFTLQYVSNVEPIGFSSSSPEILSIDVDGSILGLANGNCDITLSYQQTVYATIHVTVVDDVAIIPPQKTIYKSGEVLNLFGARLILRNDDNLVIEEVPITSQMTSGYQPDETGTQHLSISYLGKTYHMDVLVLSAKQEASLATDFILLTQSPSAYQRVEFQLMKYDIDDFLEAIDNVYDMEEIVLKATVLTPSTKVETILGYWSQTYEEVHLPGLVSTSRNLEGLVTTLPDDITFGLNYVTASDPCFKMRYLPKESGQYQMVAELYVDGIKIQSFSKEFTVNASLEPEKGDIGIDPSNERHFQFENGDTYLPVGQNAAWYTSQDRKYYDYVQWFEKMADSGMNVARIWLSAWGFSLFWYDVENYDRRQTHLQSLDRVIELAESKGIYLQICLLHHGMFSRVVNPMWPGALNSWYVDKYGANPYGETLTSPGQFFTDSWAKATFKNQLKYLVARYGYSDHILAWELMNETDWIEEYNASIGLLWHQEMANYLHEIDPRHLVTTSFRNDSFYSSTFNVFQLESIDFVNVHRYGVEKPLSYLPAYQKIGANLFDKPILYSEFGLKSSGSEQLTYDPDNITLHQGLWGGLMGGGAGTSMNWWWDSWIHVSDAYPVFAGIAEVAHELDLSGDEYQLLADNPQLTISHAKVQAIGYRVDSRLYAYLYDTDFSLADPQTAEKSGVTLIMEGFLPGNYQVRYLDTSTGVIREQTLVVIPLTGSLTLFIPNFSNDIALILEQI
ncbi:MAG: cellulase family glycosylhydrolase [Acholeplasmataceae bacterium]|nr:cellulase family glycosylhydrolase [Acholeplasmataceae bacterium]